jgi:hypothetical protein
MAMMMIVMMTTALTTTALTTFSGPHVCPLCGWARPADLRNGELRNVSARRAKERCRFSLLMPLLVSKLRSFTVGDDDVIIGMFASVCFFPSLQQAKELRRFQYFLVVIF